MPKTKPTAKQQEQLNQKIEDEDIAEHKPVKAKHREKDEQSKSKEDEYREALKDLLINLGSLDIDDLKQLSFVSLKIRDPMSKGLAYYDASMPDIEGQCAELLQWHIDQCKLDIVKAKEYLSRVEQDSIELEVIQNEIKEASDDILDKINTNAPEDEIEEANKKVRELEAEAKVVKDRLNPPSPPSVIVKRKTFLEKIFGSPKVIVAPDLEVYDAKNRLAELEQRLVELNEMQSDTEEVIIDTEKMYFKKWAYNYLLLCRSQLGEDNYLKMKVMLADGQIVNRQESGGIDFKKVFDR